MVAVKHSNDDPEAIRICKSYIAVVKDNQIPWDGFVSVVMDLPQTFQESKILNELLLKEWKNSRYHEAQLKAKLGESMRIIEKLPTYLIEHLTRPQVTKKRLQNNHDDIQKYEPQMKKQKTGSIFDDFSKRNVKNGHEEKILQDNDKNLVPEERNVQIERLNEQLKSELASFGKEKSELESKIQNCENLHKENQNAAAAIESPKSENVQMKAEDVQEPMEKKEVLKRLEDTQIKFPFGDLDKKRNTLETDYENIDKDIQNSNPQNVTKETIAKYVNALIKSEDNQDGPDICDDVIKSSNYNKILEFGKDIN